MWGLMQELSLTLAAFHQDMEEPDQIRGGDYRDHVSVVVMSEFGRRVAENSSLGTDHGLGGCMFVLGGAQVAGGVLHTGSWTNIAGMTDAEGDLVVHNDYRNVLAEALVKTMGLAPADVATVYPGLTYSPLGIYV